MRIAALTQGHTIPSARFRIRQLIAGFEAQGMHMHELPAVPDAYPPRGLASRVIWGGNAMLNSWRRVRQARGYDLAIVQRELISTLPSFEVRIACPVIADIDDAIWLYRNGRAARHLARSARHIVVGNSHLAQYFSAFDRPVSIIPTGVDTTRFVPATQRRSQRIIGWSGTSGGYAFFAPLQQALATLLRRNPGWTLRFISDRPPHLPLLPAAQLEYQAWSADTEAEATADFDIGLMPLDDTAWSLGKCSYKMLLYMACGVPVVSSRVGMNKEVLAMGDLGLGASSPEEWVQALEALMQDEPRRHTMGRVGRDIVERHFSLPVVIGQWLEVLRPFESTERAL